MKIMAIDYGEKRVGVASTDDSGQFALPRIVLPNENNLIDKILDFADKEGIERIVLGESKNYKGENNLVMVKVQELKSELEQRGAKVFLHPEILTTVEARRLQGQTNMTDASAAALILKNYIDKEKLSRE